MYVLCHGKMAVINEETEPMVRFKPGQCIGEYSFISGTERSATVISQEPSLVYILLRTDFDRILQSELGGELALGAVNKRQEECAVAAADESLRLQTQDTQQEMSIGRLLGGLCHY